MRRWLRDLRQGTFRRHAFEGAGLHLIGGKLRLAGQVALGAQHRAHPAALQIHPDHAHLFTIDLEGQHHEEPAQGFPLAQVGGLKGEQSRLGDGHPGRLGHLEAVFPAQLPGLGAGESQGRIRHPLGGRHRCLGDQRGGDQKECSGSHDITA